MTLKCSARLLSWILTISIVIGLGYACAKYARFLQDRSRLTKLINRVHFLTKALEAYVLDHGDFPDNLQTLAKEAQLDPALLLNPISGDKIQYTCPKLTDPGSTIVLTATDKEAVIEVNKNFERRMRPIRGP